jgi:hypothetical protein
LTCIVGLYTKDGRAFVGGDSGSFTDEGAVHILPAGKVFKMKNGFVAGCAGSRRFSEILQHVFEPPECPAAGLGFDPVEADRFLVREFVGRLRECLKAEGCLSKLNDEEGDLIGYRSGAILAVPKAGVFYLAADFGITRAPSYGGESMTATGGGMKYALASLLSTTDDDEPVRRITTALDVTAKLYNCVRSPFTVFEA